MELKSTKFYRAADDVHCFNRTFMELKLLITKSTSGKLTKF